MSRQVKPYSLAFMTEFANTAHTSFIQCSIRLTAKSLQ
jgi:hypothetical protein